MTQIGWIGTGLMGSAMCGHLLDAGHQVWVSTRSRDRAAPLEERGATWCGSPSAVAANSEVVFTMVGTPDDVRRVYLGSAGLLTSKFRADVMVDLTTSEPPLASELSALGAERGVGVLDAPVSGGDIGAREGSLTVMVGGDEAILERVRPLFDAFSRSVVHQGPAGSGQRTKAVNQVVIASGMIGICEGLVYAVSGGLDPELVIQSVAVGAAGSWSFENYAPRMLSDDLAPGFAVRHFVKDLSIALDEARRMNLCLPGTALAQQLYSALMARGEEELGIHALVTVIAELSGVEWISQ